MKLLMASDLGALVSNAVEQYLSHGSVSGMTLTEAGVLGVASRIMESVLMGYMPDSQLSSMSTTQRNEILLFVLQTLYTGLRHKKRNPWLAGLRVVQSDLMGLWGTNWFLGGDRVLFDTAGTVPAAPAAPP